MISMNVTFRGRPFDAAIFENAIEKAVIRKFAETMIARIDNLEPEWRARGIVVDFSVDGEIPTLRVLGEGEAADRIRAGFGLKHE